MSRTYRLIREHLDGPPTIYTMTVLSTRYGRNAITKGVQHADGRSFGPWKLLRGVAADWLQMARRRARTEPGYRLTRTVSR